MKTWFPAAAAVLAAGGILASSGCGPRCGDGTVEQDGACVPEATLSCGPGTVASADGSACVPDLECAPGTAPNEAGDGCVPVCHAPFVFDAAGGCSCPGGLVETAGTCGVDPSTCGEGTVFVDGRCDPISAPPRADDETLQGEPVLIALPEPGERLELGGAIDETGELQDVDVFEVEAAGGTRVVLQVIGFGAPSPNAVTVGVSSEVSPNLDEFQRFAVAGRSRRALREVVFPVDGVYQIHVFDNSTNALGEPVAGDDVTYALVLEVVDDPAPAPLPLGAAQSGTVDDLDAWLAPEAAVAAGGVLEARLSTSGPAIMPGVWAVTPDGVLLENFPGGPDVRALLPQLPSGTTLHVDDVIVVGDEAPASYSLTVTAVQPRDQAAPNEGPVVVSTEREPYTFVDLPMVERHLYRVRVELPDSTSLEPLVLLLDPAFSLEGTCAPTWFADSDKDGFECRLFVDEGEGGTHHLVVLDNGRSEVGVVENFNLRVFLDQAPIAESVSLSLASPTASLQLDAPPDPSPYSWAGPWVQLDVADVGRLSLAAERARLYAFDRVGFQPREPTAFGFFDVAPGTRLFVQAAGELDGTFELAATLAPSPILMEEEPNNAPEDATAIDPSSVPALPSPETGACADDENVNTIAASGVLQVDLGLAGDDFGPGDGVGCVDDFGDSGDDLFYRLAPRPEGTLARVKVSGPGEAVAQLGVQRACADTCLARGERELTYRYDGTETDGVLLLVDVVPGYFPAPFVTLEVEFSDDLLPVGGAAGHLDEDDVDWYRVQVPLEGMVDVSVRPTPFGGSIDVEYGILTASGEWVTEPQLGFISYAERATLSTWLVPGTYFVVVRGAFEGSGGYLVEWALDTSAEPPPTCDAPALLEISSGQTERVSGATHGAPDLFDGQSCGVPDFFFAGPESAFKVPVPPYHRLDVSAVSDLDAAAVAILGGSACSSACEAVAVSDFFELGVASWLNDTEAEQTVVVVVNTPISVTYQMFATLAPQRCLVGEARCEGDRLVRCLPDGSGYEEVPCEAGCVDDPFELSASCHRACGFDEAGELVGPLSRCGADGVTLEVCDDEGWRYLPEQTCPVECREDAASGEPGCVYGLCDASVGSVCRSEDVNGDGQAEAFVETCAGDEAERVRSLCMSGACNAAGTDCEPLVGDPIRGSLCSDRDDVCADSVATVCEGGLVERRTYCLLGCDGPRCAAPPGESCDSPADVTLGETGASTLVEIDLARGDDDVAGSCQATRGLDQVFRFQAPGNGSVDAVASDGGVALYAFEGRCGLIDAELTCAEDGSVSFLVTAGGTYFVVADYAPSEGTASVELSFTAQ